MLLLLQQLLLLLFVSSPRLQHTAKRRQALDGC
jgi:hypothetical protein